MVAERRLVCWEACRSSKGKHYEGERWRLKSDNHTTTNVTCWCHLPQNHWSPQAEESWVQNQATLRCARNSFRCHGRLCSPCCFVIHLVPRERSVQNWEKPIWGSGFLHLTMMETQAVAVATRAVGANHLKLRVDIIHRIDFCQLSEFESFFTYLSILIYLL